MSNLPNTVHFERAFREPFDWSYLLPAFEGTKISPMDLDFLVERGGLFLAIEVKNPNVPTPLGQMITYDRLVRTGYFTVIFLNGKNAEDVTKMKIWEPQGKSILTREYEGIGSREVLNEVTRWFQKANG